MLMKHENGGWHDASGHEVEEMKKNGWIESSYKEYAAVVAKKTQKPDNTPQSQDEVEGNKAQPSGNYDPVKRRGRPRG